MLVASSKQHFYHQSMELLYIDFDATSTTGTALTVFVCDCTSSAATWRPLTFGNCIKVSATIAPVFGHENGHGNYTWRRVVILGLGQEMGREDLCFQIVRPQGLSMSYRYSSSSRSRRKTDQLPGKRQRTRDHVRMNILLFCQRKSRGSLPTRFLRSLSPFRSCFSTSAEGKVPQHTRKVYAFDAQFVR